MRKGGVILKLGGAHLDEGSLEALAWERQVQKQENGRTVRLCPLL